MGGSEIDREIAIEREKWERRKERKEVRGRKGRRERRGKTPSHTVSLLSYTHIIGRLQN